MEKTEIFRDNQALYERLCELNIMKEGLKELRGNLVQPVVITLLGSPRAGKTSIAFNIYDFLKKSNLRVSFLEEPANQVYRTFKNDDEKKRAIADMAKFNLGLRDLAIDNVKRNLDKGGVDVVLYDRGFLDPYVWFEMAYEDGKLSDSDYEKFKKELTALDFESLNLTFALYASPSVSIRRDYLNSLSLDDRKMINEESLQKYSNALFGVRKYLQKKSDLCHYLDTSNITVMDTSVNVAENICYAISSNVKVLRKRI